MTQLSEHFTLEEMTHTAQPYDNTAPPSVISKLRTLCENVLEPVRLRFGRTHVNSGYRSPRVNAAVGSSYTSQHMLGEAADIEVDTANNVQLATWIRDNLEFDQLILEAYKSGIPGSGWVHVSYREGNNRKQVLTMRLGAHGPVYSRGIVS